MLTYQPKHSSLLDVIFSALSHPIRRAIIEQVAEGDCTVNELAEPHNISRPAISQHLKVLQEANLVEQTAKGRLRMCSLNDKPLSLAFSWIVRYRIFWDNFLDDIQEKVEGEGFEDLEGDNNEKQ